MISVKPFHIAIPTAFGADESLDAVSTIKYIEFLAQQGIDSVMVCGSTGEQHSMSVGEKIDFLHSVDNYIKHDNSPIDIIWGVSSIRQTEAIALAKEVATSHIDALLLGFPPYIRPTQSEALKYAEAIIGNAQKPVIIYNNPTRTGFDLSIESTLQLCSHPLVVGLKEAGDMHKVTILREKITKPHFMFFAVICK